MISRRKVINIESHLVAISQAQERQSNLTYFPSEMCSLSQLLSYVAAFIERYRIQMMQMEV
jgi:hypothetical protein